jgi:hypothetical protein
MMTSTPESDPSLGEDTQIPFGNRYPNMKKRYRAEQIIKTIKRLGER